MKITKQPTIKPLDCLRCGHNWIPRMFDNEGVLIKPKTCPKCRSPYWNKPRRKFKPHILNDAWKEGEKERLTN